MSQFERPKYCKTCGMLLPQGEEEVCPNGCLLPPLLKPNKPCCVCGKSMIWDSASGMCDVCRTLHGKTSCTVCGAEMPPVNPITHGACSRVCPACKDAHAHKNTCTTCGRLLDNTTLSIGLTTCPMCRAVALLTTAKLTKKTLPGWLQAIIGPKCVSCGAPFVRQRTRDSMCCVKCRKRQLIQARRGQWSRIEKDRIKCEKTAKTLMTRRVTYGFAQEQTGNTASNAGISNGKSRQRGSKGTGTA